MNYLALIGAVVLGVLIVILLNPGKKLIRLLLAFSGAYLLSVTILHLLPEVYTSSQSHHSIGIFILSGIILQFILESFSKGAEHGHIHIDKHTDSFPILLFISLCIHSFTEGLPIHEGDSNLLWAIMIHKIPIAIVLSTFLFHSEIKKNTSYILLTLFALMSPLGVWAGDQIPLMITYSTQINAIIIGVFLHISTVILFESTENHKFNLQKFTVILFGILLAILT